MSVERSMAVMGPKPDHLDPKYAAQFKDRSVVDVYHFRPPYPDEAIAKLVALITDKPRTVLDVGCGTGDLSRRMVHEVERVDAVDASRAMLDRGRTLPAGDHDHLHWIYGAIEDVRLQVPYALITAGESLHWMDWHRTLPLFHRILTPHGYLAIVERGTERNPWDEELLRLIRQFSTNREYRPYDLIEELEKRQLFQAQGRLRTRSVLFTQSGEDYIRAIHSRNGFSYERMGQDMAQRFDEAVRHLLAPFLQHGLLTLASCGHIVWGKPQA
jgi:ubiquinone/menaquinone biosynthesis C-methylase UbiE